MQVVLATHSPLLELRLDWSDLDPERLAKVEAFARVNTLRLRTALAENDLDFFVATRPEDVFYLTGFKSLTQWLARSRPKSIVAVVDRDGAVLLTAPGGELGLALDAGLTSKSIVGYGGATIDVGNANRHSEADRRLEEVALELATAANLWEALRSIGVHSSRVGTDDPVFAEALQSSLEMSVETRPELLSTVRVIKTAGEIELLEKAVRLAEVALEASMATVAAGVSEREAELAFRSEITRSGGTPLFATIGFGFWGAYPTHRPGDNRAAQGFTLRWDVGCELEGYASDTARGAVLGSADRELERKWDAVLRGHERALREIRPGARACDIFEAGVQAVREGGLNAFARRHLGHGIGIELYEEPMITPDNQSRLEPGMVFELETPYYELGLGGLQVEDTIVVTEDGYRILTSLPREVRSLPVSRR